MSTRNTVTTTLEVKNNTSAAFKELSGSLRSATMQGNLLAQGLGGAFNAVSSAIGNVVGSGLKTLNSAMQTQLGLIGSVGDVARVTGMSFNEATKYTNDLKTELAGIAAALPGQTSDYTALATGIADNLVPAFKSLNGSVDTKALKQAQIELAKYGALRANFAGIQASDASLAISKALAGTGVSELKQLRFFEANPAVMAEIEKGLDAMGKDLKDLSDKQRYDLITKAMKVDDAVIKAASESASGILEGFKSAVFDVDTGMLGLMRKINFQGQDTTVLDQVTKVLKTLMGEDGVFSTIGRILGAAGFKDTSMLEGLASGLDKFNNFLISVNNWLKGNVEGLGKNLKLGNFGEIYNTLISAIDGRKIGEVVGKGLATAINMLGTYLSQIDVGQVVTKVAQILYFAVTSFISNLDFKGAATLVSGAVIAFLAPAATTALTGLLGTAMATLASMALPAIGTILSVVLGPIGLIAVAIVGVIYLIIRNWDAIKATASAAMSVLGAAVSATFSFISQSWNTVRNAATAGVTMVVNAVTSAFSAITNAFNSIKSRIPFIGGGSSPTPQIQGRASGNIPDVIKQELNMAPDGSVPVIANSSELILNRAQQANLMASMNRRSGSGSSFSFGDIIIQDTSGNVSKVADQVIAEIQNRVMKQQALGMY